MAEVRSSGQQWARDADELSDIEELGTYVKQLNRQLHAVAAEADRQGALDSDDIRELRIVLKGLGRRLQRSKTVESLQQLSADFQKAIDSMSNRLEEAPAVSRESTEESASRSALTRVTGTGPRAAAAKPRTSRTDPDAEVIVGGFTPEQQAWIDKQFRLVILVSRRGYSTKRALDELDIDRGPRWARNLLRRFEEEGSEAFVDGRWTRTYDRPSRTSRLEKLVRVVIHDRPAAGPTAIWREVSRRCHERGWQQPSCSTVKRIYYAIPAAEKAYLQHDDEKLTKRLRSVHRVELARTPNDRFQIDHSLLDVWIRVLVNGDWAPIRPWITAVIDVHSRSVAGYFLSGGHPDAVSISLAMEHAIKPKDIPGWFNKGLPNVVQHDRGADFMSNAVTTWFARAGISYDPIPPNYPNANGKIERWFQTLDTQLLRRLPGHTEAIGTTKEAAAKRVTEFLTRDQLAAEIDDWIVNTYHQTVHSTTREKPAERWERGVTVRMPEDDSIYRDMMLRSDKMRRVTNEGIRFTVGGKSARYWSPALANHVGEDVVIEYHPELLESILVKCPITNEILAEAWSMDADDPEYSIEDVKRSRRQSAKGLEARLEDYRQEVADNDRDKVRDRQVLAHLLATEDEIQQERETEDEDETFEALVAELRASDRA